MPDRREWTHADEPPRGGDGQATTLGDTRGPAVICRERGWSPGTRLVGDEGYGPTVIEITAIGECLILAKTLTHDGKIPGHAGAEYTWCLDGRDWKEVDGER